MPHPRPTVVGGSGRTRAAPDPPCECSEFTKSFKIDDKDGRRYLLHNRTPKRIRIVDDDRGELVLAPLAERVIGGCRLAPFAGGLVGLRQTHRVRVRPYRDAGRGVALTALAWLASLMLMVLVVLVVHHVLTIGTLERREVGAAGIAASVLLVAALLLASRHESRRRKAEVVFDTEEGDIEYGVGGAFYDGNETMRRAKHLITLLMIITIGAVLPAIAIFMATDAKSFLVMDGGLHIASGKESRLVGRIIQVTYTAALSLFPALLYFQFDRHRAGTIRSEWVRSIFRMDRRMTTLADVDARYGDELSEASTYSTDSVRLLGGRHSPIILATLFISLGWTLLVAQTDSFDFAGSGEITALADTADRAAATAQQAADAAATRDIDPAVAAATARAALDVAVDAGRQATILARGSVDATSADAIAVPEPTPVTAESAAEAATAASAAAAAANAAADTVRHPFFQLIVPTPSAAAMAFLGAYFFGMYLILRSYFRGDLRPKIYSQITARLITVVVLAYLIQALFSEFENWYIWSLSFLAGIIPTTVLQGMGRAVSSIAGGKPDPDDVEVGRSRNWLQRAYYEAFATPRALTQIDGINLYDSTRLETEGINDIPSLAKSDVISLMVSTSLPIDRLVDWVDQAILILLLDDDSQGLDPRVIRLRHVGIRSASGVLGVLDAGDPVLRMLAEQALAHPERTLTLDALAVEIRREPAIHRIRHFLEAASDVDSDVGEITVFNRPLTEPDAPALAVVEVA